MAPPVPSHVLDDNPIQLPEPRPVVRVIAQTLGNEPSQIYTEIVKPDRRVAVQQRRPVGPDAAPVLARLSPWGMRVPSRIEIISLSHLCLIPDGVAGGGGHGIGVDVPVVVILVVRIQRRDPNAPRVWRRRGVAPCAKAKHDLRGWAEGFMLVV